VAGVGGPDRLTFPAVAAPTADRWVQGAVAAVFDEMVDTRRLLHAHPELGFEEHQTTALVRQRLAGLGLSEEPAGTDTGAVFSLDGGREGATVVLRADIDALPVDEEVALPYRSTVDGVMHACGHDEHTASLLGVAAALSRRAGDLPGRYVFVFQPGEETCDGARRMLELGALRRLGPARLVGHHVTSQLPVGMVGLRPGVAMSEAHSLRVELHGGGGHGAMPTGTGDVVAGAAQLAVSLPSVVEGLTFEGTACVCSAGTLHAGTAPNVVPDRAVLEGTLRTFTDRQREDALARLADLVAQVAADRGVEATLTLPSHTPAVVNDPAVTAVVDRVAREVVADGHLLAMPPVGPSDDVSELLAVVPGCYFFVGGAPPDGPAGMHHSPTFAVDDGALRVSALVTLHAALALAAAPGI